MKRSYTFSKVKFWSYLFHLIYSVIYTHIEFLIIKISHYSDSQFLCISNRLYYTYYIDSKNKTLVILKLCYWLYISYKY